MGDQSIIHDKLDFKPQNLHLSIWKAKSKKVNGIIAGFHGLTSHADQCFHYLGPYMADRGWSTIATDMPGMGHWIPEKRKAEKNHWLKNVEAIDSLIKFGRKLAPNKKIFLVGVSMSVLSVIEYVFSQYKNNYFLPDGVILAVPCFHASIPFYVYPIVIPLSIFTPNIKIGLKRFTPVVKSNDPNSIINNYDPFALKKISIGYATELYKSIQKLKLKRKHNPMEKWPKNIPILILTAGKDEVVNTEYTRFYYQMLPRDITIQFINYPRAHHYIFYEDNRNEIFQDIDQYLTQKI